MSYGTSVTTLNFVPCTLVDRHAIIWHAMIWHAIIWHAIVWHTIIGHAIVGHVTIVVWLSLSLLLISLYVASTPNDSIKFWTIAYNDNLCAFVNLYK